MWREYYVAGLLFLNGIWDWKKREVCLISILVSLAAGAIGNFWEQNLWSLEQMGGLGIGVGILLLAVFTRGAIGLGDGWLLCATGAMLGAVGNFALLWTGFLICALIQGIGILVGKTRLRTRVPFVPFLFLAQLLRMLI